MNQKHVADDLATVDAHFHSEAENEVAAALELYTDDIVWEAPALGIDARRQAHVASTLLT